MTDTVYYLSRDSEVMASLEKAKQEEIAFRKKAGALATELGFKGWIRGGPGLLGLSMIGVADPIDGRPLRSHHSDAWSWEERAGNAWMRPRRNTKAGKELHARMTALGVTHDTRIGLLGIPSVTDRLSIPGLRWFKSNDQMMVVTLYGQEVDHDDRWERLSASDFWRMVETGMEVI